jgi:hypothetical protein
MSDRREAWIRALLVRTGRMMLDGLTVTGSMWCGASGIAAAMRHDALDDDSDDEIRAEARRGIEEIAVYLDSVAPSTGRFENDRRRSRRRHGDAN